jgi:hypothetical protein
MTEPTTIARGSTEAGTFVRRAIRFAVVGVVLYLALYAAAEMLVYRYAHRNRFFAVRSVAPSHYNFVVLGASHAAVFDYRDMNSRLEQMTGSRIMNLAVVGAGVTVNRLLFDYFTTRHRTDALVYVVDSFAFYSPEWNEQRLGDRRLFARAPFDPALIGLLLRAGITSAALDYASGFSKINDADRFAPDDFGDERTRFDRRYRPIPQLDEERLAYLYPAKANPQILQRYLTDFEALVATARARNVAVIVIKPPIPQRIQRLLPSEKDFDTALSAVLGRHGLELHDFSNVTNDEALFYDSDHLNQTGTLEFFKTALAPLLRSYAVRNVRARTSRPARP